TVSISDTSVAEGDTGSVTVTYNVTLSAPSGRDIMVSAVTVGGTAIPGVDFGDAFQQLPFAAGQTTQPFAVDVWGDVVDEPDEHYRVELFDLVAALPGDVVGRGLIRDDDGGERPVQELRHRSSLVADLSPPSGAGPDEDLYLLGQQPYSSYEVVVDGASGDVGPAGSGPRLDLMSSDLADVLQASVPAGLGFARSLRFENDGPTANERWYVRVVSDGCQADCGADDVYRIRAYDTTLAGARFNNSGTQVTVLILQNASAEALGGHASFWSPGGTLLGSQPFELDPFTSFAINTAGIPGLAGASGSLTVASSAPYGTLNGKTVALEPATGYSFDAPLTPRP
ncbi:MAG TPA: Calx-beta domain-containing protein, partial [Vicinamibacteria bacterium]|nr:Calx-beta domain-containing protein [Vicinamibacteria bacterium]